MQPAQCAAQARHQFVEGVFVRLVRQQAGGDLFERVGEVTVLVEGLDEHVDGGHVLVAQAGAQQLLTQVLLQGDGQAVALERVGVVVALALAGRAFADAVEVVALGAVFPVLALGGAQLGGVDAAGVGLGGRAVTFGAGVFAAVALVALAFELQ